MVLRSILFIVCLSVLTGFSFVEYPCSVDQHSKKINKIIKDVFGSDTKVSFKDIEEGDRFTSLSIHQEKDDEHLGYLFFLDIKTCNLGGCTAGDTKEEWGSEQFDALVVLNADNAIERVSILSYFSDYGYEITSKRYLKKYIGAQPCDFVVNKNKVDGISGATISCDALQLNIASLCEIGIKETKN